MPNAGANVGVIPAEIVRRNIGKCTIALYTAAEGRVVLERSGVLFQLGDRHFVVTCGHNMEERYLKHKLPLFVVPPGEAVYPIPVEHAMITVGEGVGAVVDLALIELPPDTVNILLPGHRFISVVEIDAVPSFRRAMYLVAGYPTALTDVDENQHLVTTRSLAYVTGPYEGELRPNTEYNPDTHIVLSYRTNCIGAEGEPSTCPPPFGMSGCGIWRLTEGESMENWKPEDAKLVAIQHRYDRERNYVMGTWIGLAMRGIWDRYETLRPAMTLAFPPKRPRGCVTMASLPRPAEVPVA
jgi:hypothetical protein